MKITKRSSKKKHQKLLKKSTLGLFVAIFAFAFSIYYVFAGETPKVTISSIDKTSRGEEIELKLNLENNKEYNGIVINIDYDADALDYLEAELATKSSSEKGAPKYDLATDQLKEKGKLSISFGIAGKDSETGKSLTANTDNQLGSLYFKVKDKASGKYDIKISSVEMFNVDSNGDQTPVAIEGEDGSVFVEVPVEKVELEKTNFEIQKEETDTIKVKYTPEDTTDEKGFSYKSNDESIAKVDETGKITALKAGKTTITVKAFNKEFTANVEVVAHIKEVKITGSKTELSKGEELVLNASINPSDTSDSKTLTWASTKADVATVDASGKVKALKGGETTITATSVNNVVGTYKIKVVVPITEFTTNENKITLNKGENKQIVTNITPSDTTEDTKITWTSSNQNNVSVDEQGNITGLNGGTSTITGTLKNGKKVTIEVKVIVPIQKVEVDTPNMELLPTQKQTIKAIITPSDTTEDKTVTWESKDTNIATVNNGEVTAIKPGTTQIIAKVGTRQVTATVKVLKPIDNVVISKSSVQLNKNQTDKLSVTIIPDDAEEDRNITWTSSDPSKVSVEKDGTIKGLKGTDTPVTITGTLKNGKKVECKVTVVVPITDVKINKTSTKIVKGETETLSVTITPEDTSESKKVTWSSSNNEVATVDESGKVTAVKAGSTVITAKVGNFTQTCAIEVIVPITKVEITTKENTLEKGKSINFTAVVSPSDTTEDKKVTWTSSNKEVATVDANGTVVAKSAGKATITATVGTKKDSKEIEVTVPITEFKLDKTETEIVKGKTEKLNPTINPSDTTEDTKITWKSSNEKIATVDSDGVVKAISEGTATITGTLKNGMKAQINVKVKIIPVEDIEISEEELTIKKNSGKILSVSVKPLDATETEEVKWTSSDPTIATVDSNGTVKALKKGTVTITATMKNFTKTAKVTVEEVPLESISLDGNKDKLSVGEEEELFVTLNPVDTTDDIELTYKSSDEKVLKVDEFGKIKAIGAGKATITVTANGDLESDLEVTVTAPTSPKTGVTPIGVYLSIITILSSIGYVIIRKTKRS